MSAVFAGVLCISLCRAGGGYNFVLVVVTRLWYSFGVCVAAVLAGVSEQTVLGAGGGVNCF